MKSVNGLPERLVSRQRLDWRAAQAYGTKKMADFDIPVDVNVKQMAGGSWRANFHKDGAKWTKTRGGPRKVMGRAKLIVGPIYKEKIFNPVKFRVPIPEGVRFDRQGYVIL